MKIPHHGQPANVGLPLFTWAAARDARHHHPAPHHLYVLRNRHGIPVHLVELVSRLSGFGPGDGR